LTLFVLAPCPITWVFSLPEGTVNADDNGKVIMVANGQPGMILKDNANEKAKASTSTSTQSESNKETKATQATPLKKNTGNDKKDIDGITMFFIPAVQSALLQLTNESFVNVASVGTSVLMSCAISRPSRPSSVLTLLYK
jgi:hypothetical protein